MKIKEQACCTHYKNANNFPDKKAGKKSLRQGHDGELRIGGVMFCKGQGNKIVFSKNLFLLLLTVMIYFIPFILKVDYLTV
jgi:hypothetical protein